MHTPYRIRSMPDARCSLVYKAERGRRQQTQCPTHIMSIEVNTQLWWNMIIYNSRHRVDTFSPASSGVCDRATMHIDSRVVQQANVRERMRQRMQEIVRYRWS